MKIRIRKSELQIMFMCIFIIRPYYIQINAILDFIWSVIAFILFVYSIYFVYKKRRQKQTYWLTLFVSIYLIATILNELNNLVSAVSAVGQVILAFNVMLIVQDLYNANSALKVVLHVLRTYLWIEIFCSLSGVYKILELEETMTFLGYDNYAAYILIPMLTVIWAIDALLFGTIPKLDILCWVGLLTISIKTFSINLILGLLIFIFAFFIVKYFKFLRNLLTPINAIIIVVALWIGIAVFRIHELMGGTLEALGKGSNFSFRTVIWSRVISIFPQIPIIGLGRQSAETFLNLIGLNPMYFSEANHSHNFFLEILVDFGIVGLIAFGGFVVNIIRGKKRILKALSTRILMVGIFTYILMGLVDGYPFTTPFYLMMGMITILPHIITLSETEIKVLRDRNTLCKEINNETL